jgi:hypothetical protein
VALADLLGPTGSRVQRTEATSIAGSAVTTPDKHSRQSPEAIVNGALDAGASTIAYTFTEPTIYLELAYDTAVLARA